MIEVRRRFAATPERVFDAWTLPEVLTEWWSAGPSHRTGIAEVDLRVGGAYRLSMIDGDGVETIIGGEYVEVRRPTRLAFTWTWEAGHDHTGGTTSLVEIDFEEDGDATLVTLRHSGLVTPEAMARHERGWNGCFDSLERRFT
ncbi:MAG TPA: SRPBCC domain-containing protein [Gaiellaceae bacterium]|jgi:uncharacterized protein YndB with AHSA1/START domain